MAKGRSGSWRCERVVVADRLRILAPAKDRRRFILSVIIFVNESGDWNLI